MDRRSKAVLSLSVVLALALLVPVGALAKGRPTSRPRTTCPSRRSCSRAVPSPTSCAADAFALVPPTGTPLTGYPTNPLDYYYVQGVHKWQALCNRSTPPACRSRRLGRQPLR